MTVEGPLWSRLPEEWLVGKAKHLATVSLGKMLQSSDSGDDVKAPYMRAANVQPDGVLKTEGVKEMWFARTELANLSLMAGDVVVVEGGVGGYGRAAYLSEPLDGWGYQNSINRLRPRMDNDGRYLSYYLIALRWGGYMEAHCNIVSMPHLTAEKLAAIPVPIPPPMTQSAIADFLDRETAKIDTLIAKQEQLIATLRVRRQALIEHCVFHGLVDVALGSRDEEWLPAIPAHWRVLQLGFVCDTLAGWAFPSEGFTADVEQPRLLRGVNIKPGRTDWSEVVYWDTTLSPVPAEFELRVGDLVLGMDRPFVSSGVRISPIAEDDLPALLLQRVMRMRPTERVDCGYLRYVVTTGAFFAYLEPLFTGVSVPHVSEWQVRKFKLALPPRHEQTAIAAYLDERTEKIESLIRKTERFIELSRERRAALITAAVTGQIDVRDSA